MISESSIETSESQSDENNKESNNSFLSNSDDKDDNLLKLKQIYSRKSKILIKGQLDKDLKKKKRIKKKLI
jgi:hypothetical protein